MEAVADNFDTDISSQKGENANSFICIINETTNNREWQFWWDKRNQKCPLKKLNLEVFSTEMIQEQITIKKISRQELDLEFFQVIATKSNSIL